MKKVSVFCVAVVCLGMLTACPGFYPYGPPPASVPSVVVVQPNERPQMPIAITNQSFACKGPTRRDKSKTSYNRNVQVMETAEGGYAGSRDTQTSSITCAE